jgi:hypothetical protein
VIEVEVVYDKDCPNIAGTRANLLRALVQAGVPARWIEWERSSPEVPARVRYAASPAIFINRQDVAGTQRFDGQSCRLYSSADGHRSGAPPTELIAASLIRAKVFERGPFGGRPWLRNLTAVPGIAAGLLPNVTCPACWPAYVGLLSALGLGFLMSSAYLVPLTAALLLAAVGMMGRKARERHGDGPLVLGSGAAATLLAGNFVFESQIMTYVGIAVLIAASLWNSWPRRLASGPCPRLQSGWRQPS